MTRHSDDEKLRSQVDYISAGAKLVAGEGWEALSFRRVGGAVGKSYNAVHSQLDMLALKTEVIEVAFEQMQMALERLNVVQLSENTDEFTEIVNFLRNDKVAAKLMVQVAAVAAADEAPLAEGLINTIVKARVRVMTHLAATRCKSSAGYRRRAAEIKAEALINWYVAVCMTLVTGHPTSNSDLVALAGGHRALA